MPRKAMLLTAGNGSRLRPLTNTVPKCMVPIMGKPLLEHTIEHLRRHGINKIVINLHYLPEVVPDYFGNGAQWNVELSYVHEAELLGTAGSVRNSSEYFDGSFFVWYGDNLSNCRLDRLWAQHVLKGGVATIVLHEREDPTQSGIVGFDKQKRITRFLEKPGPDEVFSHWVSAGIFVLEPTVVDAIPSEPPSDFGRDIFPKLLAQNAPLYAYQLEDNEDLGWIDTAEDLARLQSRLGGQSSNPEVRSEHSSLDASSLTLGIS